MAVVLERRILTKRGTATILRASMPAEGRQRCALKIKVTLRSPERFR